MVIRYIFKASTGEATVTPLPEGSCSNDHLELCLPRALEEAPDGEDKDKETGTRDSESAQ